MTNPQVVILSEARIARAVEGPRAASGHHGGPNRFYLGTLALLAVTVFTGTYTCPIHQYLHLLCPGCGATRALLALLHGHLHQALQLNALFTTLLPIALAYFAYSLHKTLRTNTLHIPTIPRPAQYALFTLAAVFTLARNL